MHRLRNAAITILTILATAISLAAFAGLGLAAIGVVVALGALGALMLGAQAAFGPKDEALRAEA